MRLLIKLSGGSLGERERKFSEGALDAIAAQISALLAAGNQIALVVGGGNLFRGRDLAGWLAIERATADYVGMLATVQNALVLRDYFESRGIVTRVSSAVAMAQICEGYIPKRAIRHMEKGRVVIFAAGLGAPFFTTDSAAAQRALEIGADLLVMAKDGVDGLYTGDPRTDKDAEKIGVISASEVLEKDLKFADQAAVALAREQGLRIKVIGINDIEHVGDETVGSVIEGR